MRRTVALSRENLLLLLAALLLAALAIRLRGFLLPALQLAGGGAVLAFLLTPPARLLERRLSPALAALGALAIAAGAVIAFVWLLVPPLTRQVYELMAAVPAAVRGMEALIRGLAERLRAHGLDFLALPELNTSLLSERLTDLARGTVIAAGGLAGGASRFSLMAVLSFFFLRDRKKLLLRLELLIPLAWRRTAVCMGQAVQRELRLYLRAQATVALLVGLLSGLGLLLAGVPSAPLLGLVVGVLNMIPYLGPVLGAIPTLLLALGRGPMTALWAAVALILVQQLDGSVISPRVMGSLTGISPAVVLLAIFLGGQAAGVAGMLFALPLVMAARTCVRVFVQQRAERRRLEETGGAL